MDRRRALRMLAVSATAAVLPKPVRAEEPPKRTALGLVAYCCRLRRDKLRRADNNVDLYEPHRLLEHCRQLGAGGMQVSLGVLEPNATRTLRNKAEQGGLFIEAIVGAPKEKKDLERLDAQLKTAVAVGAKAVRTTIIPGRRYEYFDSLEKFREFDARGRRSLELAAPLAEKHRIPLAVENHKDHRNDERVALFEHISSEYVGACVDTGNSFALLEDPIETVERLAPWAHSVHLKDQAVELHKDGFLLGDIPLGQGFLDLKTMVAILRKQKPDIRFSLELITRDPLKVPVLGEKYWATFPNLPASDLARTLRQVRGGETSNLQQITSRPFAAQVAREDQNVRESLDYAREHLKL